MAFEIEGKLIARFEIIQRTESFKTREFVIEKTEDFNGRSFTNYIKFQCVQDKTALPDRFNLGEQVKVSFNLKGSKWTKDGKDNYITNLDAWRIEQVNAGGQQNYADINAEHVAISSQDVADDLPF